MTNNELIYEALIVIVPKYLAPYTRQRLDETYGVGGWGASAHSAQTRRSGSGEFIDWNDTSELIRILTLRAEGRPVVDLEPALRSRLHDIRKTRNQFAHGGQFDQYQTMTALGQVNDLMRMIGSDDGQAEAAELMDRFAELWARPESAQDAHTHSDVPVDPEPARVPTSLIDAPSPVHEPVPVAEPEPGPATGAAVPSMPKSTSESRLGSSVDELSAETAAQTPESPLDAIAVTVDVPGVLSYAHAVAHLSPLLDLELSLPPAPSEDPDTQEAPVDDVELEPDPGLPGVVTVDAPNPGSVRSISGLRVTVSIESEGTSLCVPWTFGVDMLEQSVSRNHEVALDRAALLQLTQQVPSTLRIEFTAGRWTRLVSVEGPVVVAARQWIGLGGRRDVAATLATFVQPQQAAIPDLWREAAEILEDKTGSRALEGYQAGPERVTQMVGAMCSAIHAHQVAYANPPMNWSDVGQRVRTAEEVIEGRLGTCLDTTILLASALEYSGIQPLLFVLREHALLGYWRTADHAPETVGMGAGQLINQIDRGDIGLVETTMLTETTLPSPAEMDREARHRVGQDGSEVQFVVPVFEARDRGIPALPSRAKSADGTIVESEYRVAARSNTVVLPDDLRAGRSQARRKERAPERVEMWKRELLDLSLRNRLINCSDGAVQRHDVVELAVPEAILGPFEDLVTGGRSLSLLPAGDRAADARRRGHLFREETDPPSLAPGLAEHQTIEVDLTEDTYDRAFQKIAHNAKVLVEETGANNLYLAVGSLAWTSGARELRSPLILIPVDLTRGSRRSPYRVTIDGSGTSTPNYSLLERLSVDLGLVIPSLEEPEQDSSGVDIDKVIDAVRRTLIDQKLPFRVEATVFLGIFRFGGFRLWKDLEDSWQALEHNSLVRHLIEAPTQAFVDPNGEAPTVDLDDLVTRLPIAADASQAGVVAEALAGRTIVVEGPPGTGKSQTITNLIARAIADGRRVMFVAEKKAALDVVSHRLEAVGVGDLVLNLHDRRKRSTDVRQALLRALDVQVEPDKEGIRARTQVATASGRELARYRDRLHAKNAAGLSFYGARTRLLLSEESGASEGIPALAIPPERLGNLDTQQVEDMRAAVPAVSSALSRLDPRYVGAFAYLHEAVPTELLPSVLDSVDDTRSAFAAAGPVAAAALAAGTDEDLGLLITVLEADWFDIHRLAEVTTFEWDRAARDLEGTLGRYRSMETRALAYYQFGVFGAPLEQVRTELISAKNSLFGKSKKAERALSPLVTYRTGQPMPDDPAQLLAIVDELIALRDQVSGTTSLMEQVLPEIAGSWGDRWTPFDSESRDAATSCLDWIRRARFLLPAPGTRSTAFQEAASGLLAEPDRRATAAQLKRCLAVEARVAQVAGGGLSVSEILEAQPAPGHREERLNGLATWNELTGALTPFRAAGLGEVADDIARRTVDPGLLPVSFERGLAQSSIRERGQRAAFGSFDVRRQSDYVGRYAGATDGIRKEISPLLVEQALRHRADVLDSSRIRMGQLRRELERKRGGRTIRDLVGLYGDLITAITPCVLVSPDSVARFFPAERQDFDIVVFDEASQITVASAVGAMGRGRSVVVCGDSKQMPPTSFAELSRDQEVTDEDVADEESILGECVTAQVPRHWLSWHYRSQVESLIAFSNSHYYDGKLSSFPTPLPDVADPGPDGYGISMRRVEGTFHRVVHAPLPRRLLRTNPVEAEAIVEEVRQRFAASGRTPSIGIVTFNTQQRDLIETKLRETDDPRITTSLDLPDGLFVKNLENVQGDERDVILFSIAFSADAKGVVPLNFGPLNREGGERRFNVAVTRARRQVVLFCSFDPADLHAERSESVGLRDLKDYLELAANGTRILQRAVGNTRVPDRHRDQIAHELRSRGLVVHTDVGLSDFRVDLVLADADAPDAPLVAVLLDGRGWGKRMTVYDREVLPSQILSRAMGWPDVERVWMPEWLRDKDAVTERLVRAVRAAAESAEPTASGLPADSAAGTPSSAARAGAAVEETAVRDEDGQIGELMPDTEDEGTPLPAVPPRAAPQEAFGADTQERDPVPPAADQVELSAVASLPIVDTGHSAGGDAPALRAPVLSRMERFHNQTASQDAQPWDLASVVDFEPWVPHVVGNRAVLDMADSDPEVRGLVHQIAAEICTAEHPIEQRRFRLFVCNAFDMSRMKGSREEWLKSVLRRSGFVTDRQGFVWPSDVDPTTMTGYRRFALDSVDIDQIHPRELDNLVRTVVTELPDGTGDEEILRAAFEELGRERHKLVARVRSALEASLARVR